MSALILASTSASRSRMLQAAGIAFTASSPACDEESLKSELRLQGAAPCEIARALAHAKALSLSRQGTAEIVLGADQTLAIGSQTLDKPGSLSEARQQLQRLRAGTHSLPTAAALARGGQVVWETLSEPRVVFRDLSDEFIDSYLARAGAAALRSVGACEVEGLGAQLVERIEGDFFAVLGLPLLPVLEALRTHGLLAR